MLTHTSRSSPDALLKHAVRVKFAQGHVLLQIRLLKAAHDTSTDPKQKHALFTALRVFRRGIRAEKRRSALAGEDKSYQYALLMIEHECDLEAPLGG